MDLGYQIIAVSPDKPEVLLPSIKKAKPGYLLLSDSKMEASQAFGLAYVVDDKTMGLLKNYGIDIEAASGETHRMLPVPSVFLVSEEGRIEFTYVNPNYKVRLAPEVLLAAAEAARK